jgi:lipopolysaccharide export system protein LptA
VTALIAALVLGAGNAGGLAGAEGGPVKVDADKVVYLIKQRRAEFTGNPVRMTRDGALLTCDKLLAQNDDRGRIVTATCQGNVKFERDDKWITCATATFDNLRSRLTCEGNPVLHDGDVVAKGSHLLYELTTDVVNLKDAIITVPGRRVEEQQRAHRTARKEEKK